MRIIDHAARAALVVAAIISLAIALYAYANGHLLSPVRVVLYLIVPISLAALMIVAAIATASFRKMVIVNLSVVLACLVGFEIYLQYDENYNAANIEKPKDNANIEITPQTCAVAAPRNGLALTEGGRVIPLGGLSKRQISWKGYTLRTDRFGFKNPDTVWDDTTDSIVIVGDSFTYGGDAAPDRGFVEVLRQNGHRTINLGCGGNGPLAELGTLIEYIPDTSLEWIVWAYYEGNDLTKDIDREQESAILSRYLDRDFRQNLAAQQPLVEQAIDRMIVEKRKVWKAKRDRGPKKSSRWSWKSVATLTYTRTRLGLTYGYPARALSDFEMILRRVAAIAEGKNARLLFVYLPGEMRYATVLGDIDASGYGAAVKQRALDAGFEFVDVDAAFKATGRDPLSFYVGHYTDEGHAVVAAAIAEALDQ